MAPNRERTRAALHRIDAAFDALFPLGFSREVIRMTIKNPLEAYRGDEGWVFIEEASYKLLIETILEQQEEEDQKQNNMEVEGENVEILQEVADAGSTSHYVANAGSTSQYVAIESDGQHSGEDGCEDGLPVRGRYAPDLGVASGELDGCEDSGYPKLLSVTYEDTYPDNHSAVAELVVPGWLQQNNEANHSAVAEQENNEANHSAVAELVVAPGWLQQNNEAPNQERPPCYGWISESESDSESEE